MRNRRYDARAQAQAAACSKTYAPATLQHSQPLNLGQLKNQLYYYACSGACDRDLNAVQSAAKAYVAKRVAGDDEARAGARHRRDLAIESAGRVGGRFRLHQRMGPTTTCRKVPVGPLPGSRARAKAFNGTLALFNEAKAQLAVFFITGRRDSPKLGAATAKNLKAAGCEGWVGLTERPTSAYNMTVAEYKSGERVKITEKGFIITANIGDQQSDFDGGFAERAFKLPDPILLHSATRMHRHKSRFICSGC